MSDIAGLTPAEKRKITLAAKAEKARQEQAALEAEARGGRKAKNDAKENALWKVDQKATRKRTSSTVQVSDKPKKAKETQPAAGKFFTFVSVTGLEVYPDASDEEEAEPEPEAPNPSKSKASKSKSKRSKSLQYAAPIIDIDTDESEPEVEKKSVRIDFTDPATFPAKSKAKASKASKGAAGAPAKSNVAVKPAKLVVESASESDDSEYESADEGGADVAPSAREFENEVPRVVPAKKTKAPAVISDDEEMPDAPPRRISNSKRAVDKLFDEDSDTADYIHQALKQAAAIKAQKAKASDDDDDSMPELAPVSDSDDDEDLGMHEAIAKALTTVPRSRCLSTASWSSGQDVIVPDTDVDELRSDYESDADNHPVVKHKKVRKVTEACQKKANLEKPQVRPGTEIKKEPNTTTKTDAPARPESSWHPSARLVFPPPGKDIRLNDQTEEAKLVVRGGIKLLKTALLIEDSYPAILSRLGLGKGYLLASAEEIPEAIHIKERLMVDPKYTAMLADLLVERVNIVRGNIKKIGRTKDTVEELLKDHRYIFPSDPVTGRLQTELPFRHPAIVAVLKQGVFTGQFRANTEHLFISTSKKHPRRLEVPDAMVSLAATAIYAALVEYRLTGEHQSINFTEAAYEDTYRNHMKTLADTRTYAPVALHKVLHALYNDVTEARSVQPSASSSATLINLVDVPDSD